MSPLNHMLPPGAQAFTFLWRCADHKGDFLTLAKTIEVAVSDKIYRWG